LFSGKRLGKKRIVKGTAGGVLWLLFLNQSRGRRKRQDALEPYERFEVVRGICKPTNPSLRLGVFRFDLANTGKACKWKSTEADLAFNLNFGTLEPPMKRKPFVVCK